MLSITKPALHRLSRRLARKEAAEDMALRFTRREGGWTLRLDRESPGDTAFSHGGRKVLLLDEAVSKAMANMSLDVTKSGERSRLKLHRNTRRQD
jgi:Fe-S cluster assembly iron-binding protein IscA